MPVTLWDFSSWQIKIYIFFIFLWGVLVGRWFFFLSVRKEYWHSHIEVNIVIIIKPATMSPFGWHPPNLVDNTDTLYLDYQIVLAFSNFFFCFCVHLLIFMSVGIFVCVEYILKFFKSYYNYLVTQHLYTDFDLGLELQIAQISKSKCLSPKIRGN